LSVSFAFSCAASDGLQRHARFRHGALKSPHQTPADPASGKNSAPVRCGRRAFPIFAKANKVIDVQLTRWIRLLRETMLVRGDLTRSRASPQCPVQPGSAWRKVADVVVLFYPAYGVTAGNAIIASPVAHTKPEAVKAFHGLHQWREKTWSLTQSGDC
jgi:NitT/TauT family transport system substrate-binding protein